MKRMGSKDSFEEFKNKFKNKTGEYSPEAAEARNAMRDADDVNYRAAKAQCERLAKSTTYLALIDAAIERAKVDKPVVRLVKWGRL